MLTSGGGSRRDLLRALAAVGATGVLAGCDLLATPPPEPDPLLGFLTATKALVDTYSVAIDTAPGDLAATLGPIRDTHRAHADALTKLIKPPSASAAPPGSAPSVPASGGLKAALLGVEKAAAKSAYETCLTVPAARATLLGEIAAARATHVTVLS